MFSLIHWFRARFLTSFSQHPPASLCASRPIFSSEELFTSVSETCMHHGAIRCHYLISLRIKMNRGASSWNISVCFDYDIQVLWLTSNRCWVDVGGDINPTSKCDVGPTSHGWYWPNVGQTSAQHMSPCSFFHFIIWQNYSAPKSSQCWKQRSILIQSCYGYRPTVLTWKLDSYWHIWGRDKMDAIFQTPFSSAFSWMKIYKFQLNFH